MKYRTRTTAVQSGSGSRSWHVILLDIYPGGHIYITHSPGYSCTYNKAQIVSHQSQISQNTHLNRAANRIPRLLALRRKIGSITASRFEVVLLLLPPSTGWVMEGAWLGHNQETAWTASTCNSKRRIPSRPCSCFSVVAFPWNPLALTILVVTASAVTLDTTLPSLSLR